MVKLQEPRVAESGAIAASGLYAVTCVAVENVGPSAMYPDDGDQYRWKFRIDRCLEAEPDDDQDASVGTEVWAWTSDFFGVSKKGPSKMFAWSEALLGRQFSQRDNGTFDTGGFGDTDELIGLTAKATVTQKQKQNGGYKNEIVLMPLKKKKASPAPPPPPPPVDTFDDEDDDEVPF